MKKLLFFLSVVLLNVNSFSQGHTENFNDGDLTGWSGQADYVLTNTGTDLQVAASKVDTWNSFQYDFTPIDISSNPYVSLKVRTDIDFNLNFSVWDDLPGDNYSYPANHGYVEITHSDDYAEYTFDFTGIPGVDLTRITRLNFVFNPNGAHRCNSTVYFDDIQIGDVALVMPEMTKIQDHFHVMNTPAVTVPFWGVRQRAGGAISITATSSNTGLIPDPTVTYTSPDAEGSLAYTPVANQAGMATITVTVAEVGAADDKVFTFDVNIETNLAPTIDQADDENIIAGVQNDIVITGLDDGNPNDNQDLTIVATSSNTGIVPNPNVDYTAGDFVAAVEILPGMGQTGTVTITVTVQDNGGTINGGVDTEVMTFDVTVYEAVNNPPSMKQLDDISILENEPEQTIELIDIFDGDDVAVQGISITASSSNPGLIPDPTVVYSSGLNSGQLLYTSVADQTGTATITVTLTDDGGLPINNGNESNVYTFEIEVRVAPIIGWADEFDDGIVGSQWPDVWGSTGEDVHQCNETGGIMEIEIDKTRTNNKWAGLWFNIPNELDISDNPYISIRMRIDPANIATTDDMLIFLWDAYDHYNTAQTVRYTVTSSFVEYYFDYSDPSYQLQGDGTPVDISRIKALLFNFDPGGATPFMQGSFYFDDLRIGDQANTLPITPQVSMDTIPGFAVIQDAAEQTITITNLTDGADNSVAVSLAVVSSNTGLIPTPVASAVSGKSATLTYTPGAGQTGTSTITVTASAAGSISNVQSFNIDVVNLTAGTADDITIDLTTEYQEIDGFGAMMGASDSKNYSDTIITLSEDIGVSLARIGIIGGGFEEINDNSDPYIINLDAFNTDALPLNNIRRIAPFVDKFILSMFSPAGWMKTNKTEDGVGYSATDNHLEPRHYEEYAEEMIAAVKLIKRETGVEIYAIGLQNEPQFNEPYSSCQIDWNEFRDMIKVLGARLDSEGLGHIKIFFAEALPGQGALDDYMDAVKNDPVAEGYADIAALHNYDADGISVGGAGCSEWIDFYTWATTGGTGSQYKTWMTETSGHPNNIDGAMNLAGNIFNALDCGNVSGWVYLKISNMIVRNKPSAKYYVSKQYYKFIRPGAIRVDATSAGIPALAFKNDDEGTITVILFNNTTSATAVEIIGANLPDQWESYTTSDRRNCERGLDVGADGLIILPPSSLTTLVGYTNVPPRIDPIANETISQDSPTQTVNLTGISDGEAGTQTLTITATSDNQALIPDPVITYTNGNATGTLDYTPAAGLSGSATITVTLTDDGSPVASIIETFTINVVSVNNAPAIDAIGDETIDEDDPLQTINLTGITDGDGETQNLTITLSGYDAGLIGTPTVNYTAGNSTGTITYTPLANLHGTTTVTVTLQDDGGTANGTDTYITDFDITVNDVNDEPVITIIADQNAAPSTLKTVNLMGIGDGDPEVQAITITATSDATGIVPDPTVNYTSDDATGTLTFTPLALGMATITVTVQDDGGTANGGDDTRVITFDVEVTATVNENPTIDVIADETVNYGAPMQTVNLTGIADGDGGGQAISITATSDNTALIPDPTVNYTSDDATGTLDYTPAAASSGTATITVTVTDDGTPAASTIIQFDITVNSLNTIPTLDAISTPAAINEDNVGTVTVNLANITDGGDGGQTLTVTADEVTSSGDLLTNLSVTYTSPNNTATVSYEALPNANGDAVIYITVKDDGGTAGGAVDSVRQQFIQTINAVNDAPLCDAVVDQTLEADNTHAVILTGLADGDDELTQTISVSAVADDLLIIPSIIYSGASKALTFTIPAGATGTTTVTVTVNDGGGTANGGVEEITLTFDVTVGTVGIADNAKNTIMLYPNPATNFVNVMMFENTFNTLLVTDIVGRVMTNVDVRNVSNEYRLDVSQYSKGAYMITLINDSGKYSARFIVE